MSIEKLQSKAKGIRRRIIELECIPRSEQTISDWTLMEILLLDQSKVEAEIRLIQQRAA
jgi:hypothetical protein